MIIEMRTYKTKPGMRERFLEVFRAKSIPAHAEIGMKILGPFNSVEDAVRSTSVEVLQRSGRPVFAVLPDSG